MTIYLKSRDGPADTPKSLTNPKWHTEVPPPSYGERPTAVQVQGLPTTSPSDTGLIGQPEAATKKEVVFCHACKHQWYKQKGNLTCPKCQGEATEILSEVETPFAPRAQLLNKRPKPVKKLPVRPSSKNHQNELVRTRFNFNSTEVGDLVLKKGDVVKVTEKISPEWWRGTRVVIDSFISGAQVLLDGIVSMP
jgi:uncharacterized Zn finger protein (UPF0148 family)